MTKRRTTMTKADMDARIEDFIVTHDLSEWDVVGAGRSRFGYFCGWPGGDMRKVTKIVNALKKLTFVHSTVEINIKQNNLTYKDDEDLADNGHEIEVIILLDWVRSDD